MTAWDPTSPSLLQPRREGGYPIAGLWDPNGEGNPLLWRLIELLTSESDRPAKKASRKNIVDRRGGRIPLEKPTKKQRDSPVATRSSTGLSPLDVLIRWINDRDSGVKKKKLR